MLGVAIKKMAMIKRFKEILEGDLSLFEKAASLAPQEFQMNADKTQLRCIKKEVEEVQKEHVTKQTNAIKTHIELQNKRSIYAVSFLNSLPRFFSCDTYIILYRKVFLLKIMSVKTNYENFMENMVV
jgi:hypothetical protein